MNQGERDGTTLPHNQHDTQTDSLAEPPGFKQLGDVPFNSSSLDIFKLSSRNVVAYVTESLLPTAYTYQSSHLFYYLDIQSTHIHCLHCVAVLEHIVAAKYWKKISPSLLLFADHVCDLLIGLVYIATVIIPSNNSKATPSSAVLSSYVYELSPMALSWLAQRHISSNELFIAKHK